MQRGVARTVGIALCLPTPEPPSLRPDLVQVQRMWLSARWVWMKEASLGFCR